MFNLLRIFLFCIAATLSHSSYALTEAEETATAQYLLTSTTVLKI